MLQMSVSEKRVIRGAATVRTRIERFLCTFVMEKCACSSLDQIKWAQVICWCCFEHILCIYSLYADLVLILLDNTHLLTNSPPQIKPPAPTQPWTTRERLTAFYTKYQPDKLDGIDAILDKYAGKEDKLFTALVKKYGDEPEDPYITAKYGAASDDEDDNNNNEDSLGLDKLEVSDKKKRRGAAAKSTAKLDTRIILQKISRNRKKAVTHIVGMDTVPNMNLKDASKAFSKRFAGSSSVKDKEIIIQGDHLEECADMIVKKFGVKAENVYLDIDGEFVPFSEY